MICVVQRVSEARVTVQNEVIGQIGQGLLVLAAVERDDSSVEAEWIATKIVSMRIFRCCEKHFDVDVKQIGGSILLVSNFTVAAATRKGRRPSFDPAADPADAQATFERLIDTFRSHDVPLETGRFGASMQVSLVNDGPATFIVQTDRKNEQA